MFHLEVMIKNLKIAEPKPYYEWSWHSQRWWARPSRHYMQDDYTQDNYQWCTAWRNYDKYGNFVSNTWYTWSEWNQ